MRFGARLGAAGVGAMLLLGGCAESEAPGGDPAGQADGGLVVTDEIGCTEPNVQDPPDADLSEIVGGMFCLSVFEDGVIELTSMEFADGGRMWEARVTMWPRGASAVAPTREAMAALFDEVGLDAGTSLDKLVPDDLFEVHDGTQNSAIYDENGMSYMNTWGGDPGYATTMHVQAHSSDPSGTGHNFHLLPIEGGLGELNLEGGGDANWCTTSGDPAEDDSYSVTCMDADGANGHFRAEAGGLTSVTVSAGTQPDAPGLLDVATEFVTGRFADPLVSFVLEAAEAAEAADEPAIVMIGGEPVWVSGNDVDGPAAFGAGRIALWH